MFCVLQIGSINKCSRTDKAGNCRVYPTHGVVRVNRLVKAGVANPCAMKNVHNPEPRQTSAKKVNPIKRSKKAGK